MTRFVAFEITDVRFPTSLRRDGSDAMNVDPDYSAAYVAVRTDAEEEGCGFVFTIGRGTEIVTAAIRAVEPLLMGRDVDEVLADMGATWRDLFFDSQLRWLGPDKGLTHMATGAVVNALWDLKARRAGQPLWRLLSQMTPAELVDLVDFRWLTDAITREEALELLTAAEPGRIERAARLEREGYPAYTTSAGWLGYPDDKVRRLVDEAIADGFTHLKLKVGQAVDDDVRRVEMVRAQVGPDVLVSIDANQRWSVGEAIANMRRLAEHDVYWIEEPTSPDDILGHAAIRQAVRPVLVASGEHGANAVMFKQLIASGAIDVCQLDACRVGGVNEQVAILLLAAKYGVPVCPHAGGVGLCEVVQHLAMFDYVAVSGSQEGRWIEFVDHLHEHFETPVEIRSGRYLAPTAPGNGARMTLSTLVDHRYPEGSVWQGLIRRPQSDAASVNVPTLGGVHDNPGSTHTNGSSAQQRSASCD